MVYCVLQVGGLWVVVGRWLTVLQVGGLWVVEGRWFTVCFRSVAYGWSRVDGLLCASGRWPMGGRRSMVYCVFQVGGLWVVEGRWFTVCFRSVAYGWS